MSGCETCINCRKQKIENEQKIAVCVRDLAQKRRLKLIYYWRFVPGRFQNFFGNEKNQLSCGIDSSEGVAENKRAIGVTVVSHKTYESFVCDDFSGHRDTS